MGATIRNPNELHGKVVTLTRKGKEVSGVLVARDSRVNSSNFSFRWNDSDGVYIDAVSADELKSIREDINPEPQQNIIKQTGDKKKQTKSKKE